MPIDYKKYPENWLTEIRPAVLKRANDRCEQCKAPNYAHILRGKWHGQPVYQDENGMIYNAEDGRALGGTVFGDIERPAARITRVVLTIAHDIYDEDKTKHCELHELKALCQRCHLVKDLPHHIAKAKETRARNKQQLKLDI